MPAQKADVQMWNRRQESVLESNRYMFEHKDACDVTFLVQYPSDEQPTRIPAHKYVLYSRSPVFYAQFCGSVEPPCEKTVIADASSTATVAPPEGDILIDDLPAEAFTELLR